MIGKAEWHVTVCACLASGSTSAAAPGSCFQRELNRAIMALANAFFQSSWGAAEKVNEMT